MSQKSKRLLQLLIVAIIVAGAAFVAMRVIATPTDLKSAIAAALHLPKERTQMFFVNLPPAASRYPGAILAGHELLVLQPSTASDTGITQGESFTLTSSDSNVADALSGFQSNAITTAGRDKQNIEVTLEVSSGHVLEMNVDDLKHRLLSSQSAQSAANRGTDPIVITRAYSGMLKFILRQKSSAGAKLVADAAKSFESLSGSVKIDANKAGQGELSIQVEQPAVFAFEASSANYITHNLSPSPDDVSLRPVKPEEVKPVNKSSSNAPAPWVLATISSGYYANLRTINQPWNTRSADAVEGALGFFQPRSTLRVRATPDDPLSEDRLRKFVNDLVGVTHASQSRLIVVYFIGHTLSWPNGDIALVLGNAIQIPEPHRDYSNDAISERVGKNVGSLFNLADTLNANLEKLPTGYLPLREFYADLSQVGVSFALIIDGCLRNDEFETFRNGLGIISDAQTRTFFYIGPDGQQLNSLNAFENRLRHFADGLPYLRTQNPVILAAKPGTFAQPWTDPDLDWSEVGPLSARITNYVRAAAWDEDRPTLGEVLSNVTEYKGTGEISPKGSVSWSDFDGLRRTTALLKLPVPQ